jgi:biopolymer transport protein ExbB/TolQ
MTAIAIDKRGAQSAPTAEKSVLVKVSWLLSLGSSLISTLALIVPILALVFVVVFIFVYGFHKIRVMRKKLRRELRGVETMVNKAFALLKEEVEDSIHLLEHTKSKRRLTEEEDAIILRLRKNLNDAEKVIHKQVEDMEREIEK